MNLETRLAALFPADDHIPPHARQEFVRQREYLVDGRIRMWDGPGQDVSSAICGPASAHAPRMLGSYPLLTETEARAALDAAVRAYDAGRGIWPTLPVEERIRHVEDFVSRMKGTRTEVVKLLMWEIGKSRPDAEKEFDRTVEYIENTVDALKDLDRVSSRFVIQEGVLGQIRRAPLGVVLCLGPYNYPLNETFTTLIPALLMGNAVIMKPPRIGVLLHRPLLAAFAAAFPPGVVNVIYGEGERVVGPLLASGQVDVLAFIGSSRVADILKRAHPKPHRLRCVLGLEAKNPGIVLADADLDLTVKECVQGALSFNGQRCTALKILFVHRAVVEEFLSRMSVAIGNLRFGMPWEDGVQLTPLPEPARITYLTGVVEDAVARGARVMNPGGGATRGTFFYPALVYPVTPEMRLYREEQFGPVIPVRAFDTIEEPMQYLLASDFGQQVSVFGKDPDLLGRLIDTLVNQVCRVNLNSQCQRGPDTFPFTGRKDSAEGTLSVSDALRVFSIRTLVAAKTTPENKAIVSAIVRERKSAFLSTDFVL